MTLAFASAEDVARCLPMAECIPLMREAMIALSDGGARQLLRNILDLPGGRMFGVMPGAIAGGMFGAKLVSVFPDAAAAGGRSHQGLVVLFDGESGAPTAVFEAGEITAIRTAAASAAATDVLARENASRLAILGTGEQALRHIEAIRLVRRIDSVAVWGRSFEKAEALADRAGGTTARSVEAAVEGADIICTTTSAYEPILHSEGVGDGAHINAVGSSRAGPAEIDNALVARSRFFADHREGVLAQGAEFLRAVDAGLIGEDHLLGEIGEVMAGRIEGRRSSEDVTVYKSLGSIVQDLFAARHILAKLRSA